MTRPTFQQACARYVHRFTMQHVPEWARAPLTLKDGTNGYYKPQHATCREWYDSTVFPGEADHKARGGDRSHCISTPTWPMGSGFAAEPFQRAA